MIITGDVCFLNPCGRRSKFKKLLAVQLVTDFSAARGASPAPLKLSMLSIFFRVEKSPDALVLRASGCD